MASASYAQLVAKTSSLLFDHEDLKGIITAAKAGDMLAVLDRNDLEGEWRNARLLRLEDTTEEVQWRLLTEDGVVIDEPGDVRQPRHLTLAIWLAMPTSRPHAGEGTRPTMAHCRPLRLLWSHCEQTQRSLLGSGER